MAGHILYKTSALFERNRLAYSLYNYVTAICVALIRAYRGQLWNS